MSSILAVELWFDHEPVIDRVGLVEAVRSRQPDATTASTDPARPFLIAFPTLVHHFPDGPAAMLISVGKPHVRNHNSPPHDFTQTWSWPEAERTFAAHTHTLTITDVLGRVHATQPRVAAFGSVVDAILELTQPIGTWWPISGVALSPAAAATAPLLGLVNVRLFNDADRPGHLLMDTIGMHALGLPDLQVHFRELPEGRVAALLYYVAENLLHGTEIRDGATVQGLATHQRWHVTQQAAMTAPDRPVLHLDPGPDHT